MGDKTDEIKQHIVDERGHLSRNLDEIENRWNDATDLKAHFDRNTPLILGAAVAGGILLSQAFVRTNERRTSASNLSGEPVAGTPDVNDKRRIGSTHFAQISETVDDIFAGLVGVCSERLQSLVADMVPGFRQQYDLIKRRDSSGRSR